MARRRTFEEQLRAVEALRHQPAGPEVERGIRTACRQGKGLIVAAAAQAVVAHRLVGMIPDLLDALSPMYADPVARDAKCRGKLAVIHALDELEHADAAPFLQAVTHRQPEPVWGGQVDSAAGLRIRAAQALVRQGHFALYGLLGDLLVDPVGEVRGAAAQLLGAIGGERAVLLLRLRVRVGEDPDDPEVLADHVTGLLACDGEASLPIALGLLRHSDRAIVSGVALAVGASRLPAALEPLMQALERADERLRRVLIQAVALLRSDAAAACLIGLVEDGDPSTAAAALEALRLYRDRTALVKRIGALLIARADATLQSIWSGVESNASAPAPGRSGSRPQG